MNRFLSPEDSEAAKDGKCPAIVGNVIVYRDNNHFTATYSRSLSSLLEKELRKASGDHFKWIDGVDNAS